MAIDWDVVGSVGEILGALLVALSLVYLAGQVRLANRISRAEAWRSANSRLTAMNTAAMVDPVFRRAFNKVFMNGALRRDLDEDERMVMGMYFAGAFGVLEQTWREIQEGVLPSSAMESPSQIFALPYARDVWPLLRRNHPEEAARFIEVNLDYETPEPGTGAAGSERPRL